MNADQHAAPAGQLSEQDRAELYVVYRRFMDAKFGELNETAMELRKACRAVGWPGGSDYLPWARTVLRGTT